MATKRTTKKAPAKKAAAKKVSKAADKTLAERIEEKRANAAKMREIQAAFDAQYGEGHNKLEDFLASFENYDSFNDPAELEYFYGFIRDIAKAIQAYLTHETRTLDEAFKVRRPDGYRQPAERKRFLKMDVVQRDGLTLREHGAVVDDAFFEVLAERHGIKTTVARSFYYERHKGAKPKEGKSADLINPKYRGRLNWKK